MKPTNEENVDQAIEQRARELLALGLDEYGCHGEADAVRRGEDLDVYKADLWSIRAALSSVETADEPYGWFVFTDEGDAIRFWSRDRNHASRTCGGATPMPLYTRPGAAARAKADPNVDAVLTKLRARSEVGIRKYGTTTAAAGLSRREWLSHLQQELLDAAVYCEAEMECDDRHLLAKVNEIESLRPIVKELADDLESEIAARRDGELPRRIDRDLDVVRRARALLASEEASPP